MSQFPFIAVNGVPYIVDSGHRTIREHGDPGNCLPLPELQPQEIPFDHPESYNRFRADSGKPFLTTPGAAARFGDIVICGCLAVLQQLADEQDGIDYLQVFIDTPTGDRLWFIEDGNGGAITALLPDEY